MSFERPRSLKCWNIYTIILFSVYYYYFIDILQYAKELQLWFSYVTSKTNLLNNILSIFYISIRYSQYTAHLHDNLLCLKNILYEKGTL